MRYLEIAIFCSSGLRDALKTMVESKGFIISNDAEIAVVEIGIDPPANALSIVFEGQNLNKLNKFLDILQVKKEGPKNSIIGKKGDKYEIISYEKIFYFEANGNDVYCYTHNDKFSVKNKLYELEDNLYEKGFIRISKSIIINILCLGEIIPWFDSRFILNLQNKTQLEVSKKYSKQFKDFIGL